MDADDMPTLDELLAEEADEGFDVLFVGPAKGIAGNHAKSSPRVEVTKSADAQLGVSASDLRDRSVAAASASRPSGG